MVHSLVRQYCRPTFIYVYMTTMNINYKSLNCFKFIPYGQSLVDAKKFNQRFILEKSVEKENFGSSILKAALDTTKEFCLPFPLSFGCPSRPSTFTGSNAHKILYFFTIEQFEKHGYVFHNCHNWERKVSYSHSCCNFPVISHRALMKNKYKYFRVQLASCTLDQYCIILLS